MVLRVLMLSLYAYILQGLAVELMTQMCTASFATQLPMIQNQ
jgi:hypothetical protein